MGKGQFAFVILVKLQMISVKSLGTGIFDKSVVKQPQIGWSEISVVVPIIL